MSEQREKTVLFLCTGNYYRSRFAECFFNSVASETGLPWRATSRGLAVERGTHNIGPMAKSAIASLENRGLRGSEDLKRFPVQLAPADLETAHLIVALKQVEHLPLLRERFPAWADKVEFWHIDDAPGVLGLIEKEVAELAARLRTM